MAATRPLWSPSPERVARAEITRFMAQVNAQHGLALSGYDALYDWSVANIADFWRALWRFTEVVHSAPYSAVLASPQMPGARWFEGARLNYAQNLLRYRDQRVALVWQWETGARTQLSYAELYSQVARFRLFLERAGVKAGDRVVGFVPNRIEPVVAMLAAASIGAVWSSCSPDFGLKGVLDRFGQIAPKVLIAADGYRYGGKVFDSLARVREVVARIDSIDTVVILPQLSPAPELDAGWVLWPDALDNDATEIDFAQLPFDHPLYVMYSSGTTGVPKCILHGHGGTLLQHAKEHILHTDVGRDDVVFYFTTCGWMMWNWLVSALHAGATVVLYEGSPAQPSTDTLWQMAEDLGVTVFGTSPKFLTACAKAGLQPGRQHDLSRLRTVLSTGSPLSVENFEWVAEQVGDVQLASICGGTDIIGCFMLGSPISPVYAGEIQKRGLAMAVEAWSGQRQPQVGHKAELVCTKPFPSMPVGFWNDPNGARYRAAYFEHFPGIWRHGDFIEITERGGVIVYGRSDATLNPGGVRIGTAEIYRQVEAMDEVVDSLVIGQRWQDDTRVVLFVVLRAGVALDHALRQRIKHQIRVNTSPRHVPAITLAVPEVPRTISGKKVEIAVTRHVHGEPVANRDALKNPEALDFFTSAAVREALG